MAATVCKQASVYLLMSCHAHWAACCKEERSDVQMSPSFTGSLLPADSAEAAASTCQMGVHQSPSRFIAALSDTMTGRKAGSGFRISCWNRNTALACLLSVEETVHHHYHLCSRISTEMDIIQTAKRTDSSSLQGINQNTCSRNTPNTFHRLNVAHVNLHPVTKNESFMEQWVHKALYVRKRLTEDLKGRFAPRKISSPIYW